ncbi:hypothetical protein KP509_08G045000 [Ceratopteris richardii]|uniref:Uncharacterized protein n=1 Tax=Ceratopteris richardii TaxID=49495 RepID=A0A8T2U6D5_CERRI|nr:hypothetical protein KP509_08G044900 [Ceratopteris richardii]KAH7431368.1 hypothetical protein KP509_08G045000 [Ceratopteris richardii]
MIEFWSHDHAHSMSKFFHIISDLISMYCILLKMLEARWFLKVDRSQVSYQAIPILSWWIAILWICSSQQATRPNSCVYASLFHSSPTRECARNVFLIRLV